MKTARTGHVVQLATHAQAGGLSLCGHRAEPCAGRRRREAGMVSKLFKLAAVPAGLALTSYGLYAVTDHEPRGDLLSPTQLSIYSSPFQKSKYVEEQPGRMQIGFSVARQTVWPYMVWGKHVFYTMKNGIQDTIQFGKDSYVYLKNPPPEFLARAGVITVSGLTGLVLARKGTRLKKIVYPVGLTALGVSVCYPTQAVLFAKLTGRKIYYTSHRTYDAISSLWKTSPKEVEKPKTQEGEQKLLVHRNEEENKDQQHHLEPEDNDAKIEARKPESETENQMNGEDEKAGDNEASTTSASIPVTSFRTDARLVDHGQSNPEDQDLYSTRS